MVSIPQPSDSEHPLLKDRKRLNRIIDIMYAKIHKTLYLGNAGRRQMATADGTSAVNPDDVLIEAFVGLLEYSPEDLKHTWEGLAVRIAQRRTIDAVRAAQKGLRGTEHRPQLRLVSGDAESEGPGGKIEPALFEVLPGNSPDPEAEYLELEFVLVLRDLARDVLDERAREVFFAIHFEGYNRIEVAERLGLTSQRISQIYLSAARSLYDHPNYPFKLDKRQQGGTDDD